MFCIILYIRRVILIEGFRVFAPITIFELYACGFMICLLILAWNELFTVAGFAKTLQAAGEMTKELLSLRTDAAFDAILDETNNMIEDTGIEKRVVPRVRRPPKRFDGNSQTYQAPSIQVRGVRGLCPQQLTTFYNLKG